MSERDKSVKSDVIYQGTVVFCRRFLPARGDRTVDQMTQAARSCKQNIAEGSAAAATSLETQIKLTNVARVAQVIEQARRAASGIARRKGWRR